MKMKLSLNFQKCFKIKNNNVERKVYIQIVIKKKIILNN